ncbi:MAG: hypothetical protein GY868_06535, partial [Deltaproteobacteria bacterium]|nr:hypothetical protein [Deltaproteobacteria bacterium]
MYYYRYKLITPQGSVSSGITRLPYKDEVTAMTYMERDGGTAVYVKPLGALLSWSAGIISGGRGTRPSRTVQADFLNNLAVMLQSGISLTASLEQAAASLNATSSVANIKHMVNEIQGGSSFSETADRNQNIFPKNIVYLIRIGEATGRLAEMLKKGAEHLQKIQAIINDTRQ